MEERENRQLEGWQLAVTHHHLNKKKYMCIRQGQQLCVCNLRQVTLSFVEGLKIKIRTSDLRRNPYQKFKVHTYVPTALAESKKVSRGGKVVVVDDGADSG